MAGRLVTIATFEQGGKAHLARGALEATGIKATIADEAVVAMDWLLGSAVGWVKVQVLEEDADRAVTVLEEALGGEPVDEATMAAEAEAAEREETEEPPVSVATTTLASAPTATETDEAPEKPSERDEYARRSFLTAFFGLVVPLLWFYAVYLFLNAAFGPGPIAPRWRNKLLLSSLLLAIGFFSAMYLVALYGDPFP